MHPNNYLETISDDSGCKTPEEVVKRHGVGHGNNPDLMAEMKEKRASMVQQMSKPAPPGPADEDPAAKPAGTEPAAAGSVFGKIKLR